MEPRTRKIILALLAAAVTLALLFLFAGCGDTEPNRVPNPKPSPIASPTPIPSPSVTPTPTAPPMTQEIMNKMIAEAVAKAMPSASPTPKMSPIPIPEIINPFETEEERLQKAARKGFVLTDESGQRWAILSRDDGVEVTKGLPIERTTIKSGEDVIPYTIKDSEGWKVQWQKRDSSNPAQTVPAQPTPTAIPGATTTPDPAPTNSPPDV